MRDNNLISQTDLFAIYMRMPVGFQLTVSEQQMFRFAEGMLHSLLLDGPARRADINAFVEQTSKNWGVEWTENADYRQWTMRKLDLEAQAG